LIAIGRLPSQAAVNFCPDTLLTLFAGISCCFSNFNCDDKHPGKGHEEHKE